jgi:FkbM family methyltransferase
MEFNMLKNKATRYIRKSSRIIHILGFYKGFSTVIKAKVLRSKTANAILRLALHEEKFMKVGKDIYKWRGKVFRVPHMLLGDFSVFLCEIAVDKIYAFESAGFDVVVDIGGFLGETAWWFITEGYGKRIIVFEPVYYDICKRNVGDIAEVYPQAVGWSRRALRFKVREGCSQVAPDGDRVVETITLAEVLNSLTGKVAVKMDCEGCEEAILHTPCEVISKAEEYIIEIHPCCDARSIVKYMEEKCGFNTSLRLAYSDNLAIYHFRRRHFSQ